jgi:hypothetical protein
MNIFNNNEYYERVQQFINNHKGCKKVIKKYKTSLRSLYKNTHFIQLLQTAEDSYSLREKKTNKHFNPSDNAVIKFVKTFKDSQLTEDDFSSRFIPETIKNAVLKSITEQKVFKETFKLHIQNVRLNIHCFRGGAIKDANISRLHSFLEIVVSFLLNFVERRENKTFHIELFFILTNHLKTFNIHYDTCLKTSNINSGLTSRSDSNKRIIIYRYEECYKVLLHELIHAIGLDMADLYNIREPKIKKLFSEIKNNFNIHSDYNNGLFLIEESYTEFWASFIYTLFYCIERTQNKLECIKMFSERYSTEYIYSIIKINNIIKYNTLIVDVFNDNLLLYSTSLGNVFKNITGSINDREKHSQEGFISIFNKKIQYTDTSLIEYYIIKTIFMANINELFIVRNNYINPINLYGSQEQIYNSLLLLKSFIKNINNFSSAYYLIDNEIKTSNLKTIKHHENKKSRTGNENKINNKELFKTLCMTTFH